MWKLATLVSELGTAAGTVALAVITYRTVVYARKALESGEAATTQYVNRLEALTNGVIGEIGALKDATSAHVAAMHSLTSATIANAQVVALAHYQMRYAHLAHEKRDDLLNKIEPSDSHSSLAQRFFEEFWTLHFEEWVSFRGGMIKPLVFRNWLFERREEFRTSDPHTRTLVVKSAGGNKSAFNYSHGWEWWTGEHHIRDQEFLNTIDYLVTTDMTDTFWEEVCRSVGI
jgi:thioester reductase-like protein